MEKKRGFPALLLALVLALTLAPISAFASGVNYLQKVNVAYTHIDYKAGEAPRMTASVTEGNCTVAYEYWREIYQKEEGGVWSGTGRYWYSDSDKMASLSADKRITQFEAGHHYSYNIVLVANSGYFFGDDETVVSVGDYEWGTPHGHTNLEIKEMSTKLFIYSPYSIDIPGESQPSTVSSATIENVKFDYQSGDAPRATATVAAADADKYEITYECWQQFENNNPVAAWYSDNGSHGSLPTIAKFENGKTYVYSIMLKPKDGYSFSSETAITVNGQSVSALLSGGSMYIPSIKMITMPTVTVIDVVEINGVTVSFKDGGKPVFTGKVPDGANYAYRCEWWELDSKTGAMSTDFGNFYENKITAFEAGKTYHYGVYVTTIYGDHYTFGPDTKLKINGRFVNYTRYEGDTSGGSDGTMWVLTDLTMTPEASTPITGGYYYSPSASTITALLTAKDAKSATDYSGGIYGLTFKSTASFSSFQGVQVDGKALDKSNYIAEAGSIEVYLKAVYLRTLAAGKHTVTILSTEGNATAEFTIGGSSASPKTADPGVALYAAAALLSTAGLAWNSKRRGQ